MKKTIYGELDFEGCMSSDGENINFIVLYDEKGNDILLDSVEGFEARNVKITIEEISYLNQTKR